MKPRGWSQASEGARARCQLALDSNLGFPAFHFEEANLCWGEPRGETQEAPWRLPSADERDVLFGFPFPFGFAVFYGLGAYTAGLSINGGLNPYAAIAAGGAVAAFGSILIGIPTFRLRGPYFAIATIGVNEAVRIVMSNLDITGGASGIRLMQSGRFSQAEHYYAALCVAVLAFLVTWRVMHSPFGLALRAIREDQDAAADLGLAPGRRRVEFF